MKFKRKRPERKNYVIEDEEYELELLKNYLTHFDVSIVNGLLTTPSIARTGHFLAQRLHHLHLSGSIT